MGSFNTEYILEKIADMEDGQNSMSDIFRKGEVPGDVSENLLALLDMAGTVTVMDYADLGENGYDAFGVFSFLPEMDEDFFKDLGYENVTNEEELNKEIEKVLKDRKQFDIDDKFIESILEKASSNMEVEIPSEIVSDEVHRMLDQFASQLKGQGLSVEQYMEFAHKTHEDMHKDMEPEAIKRIKYRYLIEEVANKEGIEVTESEVEHDAEEMAKNYGISKEELLKAFGGMEVMKYDSKMRKTLEFLKNNN